MYDFIRFIPEKVDFDFENYVVFIDSINKNTKIDKFYSARLIKAESVKELMSKLRKVKKTEIVGVFSKSIKVNKEAVMRRKVDVLLDGIGRKLDYTTLKLAFEKDVIIELCLSKYFSVSGLKRAKIFEEDMELIRVIKKLSTPFVITSAASNYYEMRSKKQVYDFFEFLGVETKKAEENVVKLIRKYYDPTYIIDGLEIINDR